MRLERVELRNFRRFYGPGHVVELVPGVNYITSINNDHPGVFSNNGVGKTTVLQAISYALFGTTPNGRTGANLAHTSLGSREVMSVKLEFDSGTVVERQYWPGRKRSFLRLDTGSGWIEGDVADVNAKIYEHFRITPRLFSGALSMSMRDAKTPKFLSDEPTARAQLLSDLVNDRVWRIAAEMLSTDAKELKGLHDSTTAACEALARQIREQELQLNSLRHRLKTAQQEEELRLSDLRRQWEALRQQVAAETAVESDPPAESRMWELEKARVHLAKQKEELERQIQALPRVRPPMEMGVECPTCYSIIEAETVERVHSLLAETATESDKIKKQLAVVKSQLEGTEKLQQQHRDWKARVELSRERRQNYKHMLAHLEEQLNAPRVSLVALAETEREMTGQVIKASQELLKKRDEAAAYQDSMEVHTILAKGFGTEIRNLLYDRIRNDLEFHTQQFLQALAGPDLALEYPSGVGVAEKFSITVYSEGVARDLSDLSGGEFWRATLAVLLALREVVMSKTGCRLNLLLVDDPVGPVDDAGITNFLEGLGRLCDNGLLETVLVTVPDRELATTAHTITLVREHGYTKVGGRQ